MPLLLPEVSATYACPCVVSHPPPPNDRMPCGFAVDHPFELCDVCRSYDRRRDEDPRPVMERGELRRRGQAPRVLEIPF
ncbi:MAG TPA: hypothetical protein VEW95_09265 [Candidatus Limnocylindrales bacterium]|nr:hypothetical protein [Candidatus Limnocylindrales bacterium]